jgi:hypothetical protein
MLIWGNICIWSAVLFLWRVVKVCIDISDISVVSKNFWESRIRSSENTVSPKCLGSFKKNLRDVFYTLGLL